MQNQAGFRQANTINTATTSSHWGGVFRIRSASAWKRRWSLRKSRGCGKISDWRWYHLNRLAYWGLTDEILEIVWDIYGLSFCWDVKTIFINSSIPSELNQYCYISCTKESKNVKHTWLTNFPRWLIVPEYLLNELFRPSLLLDKEANRKFLRPKEIKHVIVAQRTGNGEGITFQSMPSFVQRKSPKSFVSFPFFLQTWQKSWTILQEKGMTILSFRGTCCRSSYSNGRETPPLGNSSTTTYSGPRTTISTNSSVRGWVSGWSKKYLWVFEVV